MYIYDIGIIGAGPCGIFCALSAADKGKKVVIVESGNDFATRYCAVDAGKECRSCQACNVISGFGGCVHYGDSAKLSFFPSGKELKKKLANDYDRIKNEACELWSVDSDTDFISNEILISQYGFSVKEYPVCVLCSDDIKKRISLWREKLQTQSVDYINEEMIDFEKKDNIFVVSLSNNEKVFCKKLLLAMGRKGIGWFRDNIHKKGIDYKSPISSIGFRFEMPKEYLTELGKLHPDFKARTEYNGTKYKTFCFCAGIHGGRLKFANYGKYTLLDGHILTKTDVESKYANFALLTQIKPSNKENMDYYDTVNSILVEYQKISKGRPIYQSYLSFKNMIDGESMYPISSSYVKNGPVYRLLKEGVDDYCYVAQEIFGYLANINGICIDELLPKVNVVGLELEGLWDKIITDENFMTSMEGLYIGGDCGGETQGILQATMMGIKIAEAIVM